MTLLPLVTVLIPARNEATEIEACLAAVGIQDYPLDLIEVVVVDGASEDGTRRVARAALSRWAFRSSAVLENPDATTPANLNLGLKGSAGEVICRVDARTRIEPHYVRTCVSLLGSRPDVSVVGGAQIAVPRDESARARGIARALNNRWSMGGSRYRMSTVSGPSDTVYLGSFRAAQLRAVGGWDERLPTNQDFDLNHRMGELGVVWFDASLRSGYRPRPSLQELWRQYERFGRWKVRYWRLRGHGPNRRQWVLLGLPPLVATVVVLAAVSRPRTGIALCGAALMGIDQLGARDPASLRVRAMAAAAMLVVALGWWSGVIRELYRA